MANRTVNTARPVTTPYDLGHMLKPHLCRLREFGSYGYVHVDGAEWTKLEPKSFKCLIFGYADSTKGYRVLNVESQKI